MTAPKLDRRQVLKLEAAAMAALAGGMTHAGAGGKSRHRARQQRIEMGQGAVPVLRHRLQRDGGDQGQSRGRDPWRHQVGGQSRAQLREGLFPFQDHVRPRPPDQADAAQDQRQIRQERRVHAGVVGRSLRHHGGEIQGGAEKARARAASACSAPGNGRSGKAMPPEADEGRLPHQQHRSQCAPLHGLRGGRLHAHLRHRRADGLLRRHRGRRRLRAVGLEHGRDASDPVDPGDRSQAVGAACPRRRALDLRAPLVRPRRHRHGVQAADRPLSSSTPSPTTSSRPAGSTRISSPRIPCSSAARPTSATACARNIRCRRRRPARAKANDCHRHELRRVRRSSSPTTRWRKRPRCRACRSTGSRRWPSCTPTRRSRSPASGPWDSTSTPAASGATTSSTTSIC